MTGFFARMGDRAAGREEPLQPRRPALFEAAPVTSDGLVEEVELPVVPAAAEEPDNADPRPPVGAAEHEPADPRPPARATRPEPAERASALTAPTPMAHVARAPVRVPDERDEPTAPVADRLPVAAPPRVVPPRPDPPATPAVEHERPEPLERPPAAERVAAPPAPLPPARRRRRRRAAPDPPPARAPDLATLLRDHVMPALVDRGVVSRAERPVVEPPRPAAATHRPQAPRPGSVAVRATAPATVSHEVAEPPDARGPDPTVHLHIDRVLVTRAPAPAPPAPAPPRPQRRTVDHDAYLARRRERP